MASPRTRQTPGPVLLLVGFGVDNGLQLTIEGQRAISVAEHVFSIGLPDALRALLKSMRVGVTALDDRFEQPGGYAEAYLDVAGFVLQQATEDPPVALLVPGSPMFQNTLSRFLVQTARQRKIGIQVFPSVSVVDALISDIGLDVTAGGLQLFDARQLVHRDVQLNPRVPLVILGLGALGLDLPADPGPGGAAAGVTRAEAAPTEDGLARLAGRLTRFYPGQHQATLVTRTTGRGDLAHATVKLGNLSQLAPHVTPTAVLFVNAVRRSGSRPHRP